MGWDMRASTFPFYDPSYRVFADPRDPAGAYPWSPHDDGWDLFEWGADAADERESLYRVHEGLHHDVGPESVGARSQ